MVPNYILDLACAKSEMQRLCKELERLREENEQLHSENGRALADGVRLVIEARRSARRWKRLALLAAVCMPLVTAGGRALIAALFY